MANSLLSAECLQALETARSWASALDWRRRESDIREMLSSINEKVNHLYSWDAQRAIGLPKEPLKIFGEPRASERRGTSGSKQFLPGKSGPEGVLQKVAADLSTQREESSISGEKFTDSESGVSTAHPQSAVHTLDSPRLQKKRSTSATSITSIRSEAHNTCENQVQRRVLVPILPGAARTRVAVTAGTSFVRRPRLVHLRDTSGSRLKSYPLYDDVELGLEELGHAMDLEMDAVPTNCREDDDVQTTSDVLALGVDTVERYLRSLLVIADNHLDRPVKRRMDKIGRRFLQQ